MSFLNWIGLALWAFFGILVLLPLARNWAGMRRNDAMSMIGQFNAKHNRAHEYPMTKVGFPPFLLEDGLEVHEDVISTGRGVGFFFLNMGAGLLCGFLFWKESNFLYAAVGVLVVEYLALLYVSYHLRRKHVDNFHHCMRLYAADSRLVGRLIDHNAHKRSIELPTNGRIVTVVLEAREGVSGFLDAGHYEMDIWLPNDQYTEVPWNLFSKFMAITAFLSPCGNDPDAPRGVKHRLVGVDKGIFAPNTARDLISVHTALRRVDSSVLDMTFEDYAINRAAREMNSQVLG